MATMTKQLISCHLHDYIEVACLFGYAVNLTLKTQESVEGRVKDIVSDAEKREYVLLETDSGDEQIELTSLARMQVLTPGARFSDVVFSVPE
ncbi:Rof transcriptional antiterminator [Bradymonas sediminis]|nr:Rof transcriptional antiterminator [Bradymonas sediminis]